MSVSKTIFFSVATLALSFGGIAQAESIRAGASLPVVNLAKLVRKSAKKGVESNVSDECTQELFNKKECVLRDNAATGGIGGGPLIGLAAFAAGTAVGVAANNNNTTVSP